VAGRRLQDLEFYARLAAAAGGPVLELACGTGRITRPLAAIGYDVVGVDNDPEMLEWTAPGVELVTADMRELDLGRTFGLAIVAYNSLQLLADRDEVNTCIAVAARHLRSGGILAAEVTDFITGAAVDVDEEQHIASADGISLYATLHTDTDQGVSVYTRRFVVAGVELRDQVMLRRIDESDLAAAAKHAGLQVTEMHHTGARLTWAARRAG